MKRLVYITGLLDFPVGIATAAPAFIQNDPQMLPPLLTLGAFLFFAAASLMWASQDLGTRGCIVVWQGLVRLTAVIATLTAIQMGMPDIMADLYGMDPGLAAGILYGICAFDGVISSVYIIGMSRMRGHTLLGLLRGLPAH